MGKHSAVTANGANNHPPQPHAASHKSGGTDAVKLNELAAPTAAVAFNSQKATGLASGSTSGDAVEYGQFTTSLALGATDNVVPRSDGTGGITLQASALSIDDTGFMSGGLTAKSSKHIRYRCDFTTPTDASHFAAGAFYEGGNGEPNFICTNANSATGLATANSASTNEVGVVSLATGTATNGSATLTPWSSTTAGLILTPAAADFLYLSWKVATTTVSDGTNTFLVRVGIGDTLNGAPANGVWFEWDANTDTHIKTKTCTGGAGNVVAVQTTSVVAGTGYHILEMIKPAGSSTVTFYIDGVAQASTGTFPTANPIGPFAMITKSAGGTTRLLSIDFSDFDYSYATPRS